MLKQKVQSQNNQNDSGARWASMRWIFRAIILASGLYQLFWGEHEIGFIILLALAAIMLPAVVSRGRIAYLPAEFELLLLAMTLLQLVLGEARDFYTSVPYYDKFVHYLLPFFTSFIGFTIIYSLYYSGELRAPLGAIIVVTFLVSLGIGALWEIVEFSSDEFLAPRIEDFHHFQGNAQQDALHDTMTDLIDDAIGALCGAFFGGWYIKRYKDASANQSEAMLVDVRRMWRSPNKT